LCDVCIGRIVEFLEKPHKASHKDLAALVRTLVVLHLLLLLVV
jgi:hypothetical protein